MKKTMLQWMMTNLGAWLSVEENQQFWQVYLDCFDKLSGQVQH